MKELIGNTPMIKINYKYKDKIRSVFAKLEYYNLTGSIKDRLAYFIINNAKEEGTLKDKQCIVEATSGNTGISLAAIGSFYKYPVHIFMPEWASIERRKLMESYGAKVHLISRRDGGFRKCVSEAEDYAKRIDGFYVSQFTNVDNMKVHYKTTASEIMDQMKNLSIDGFVSGVGSGGTIMGVGKRLKEKYNHVFINAIEPENMPIMSSGKILSSHKIEGIGDDFMPEIVDKDLFTDITLINDEDAINMSRLLSRELGLGVGISSGANLIGSILLEDRIDGNVVTIFADDNKKYLSTDLLKSVDNNPDFISNQIELIDYEVII